MRPTRKTTQAEHNLILALVGKIWVDGEREQISPENPPEGNGPQRLTLSRLHVRRSEMASRRTLFLLQQLELYVPGTLQVTVSSVQLSASQFID